MSNKNNTSNSKMAVPEAKEAMDKFKMRSPMSWAFR